MSNKNLFITYDGLLDPLGQSQILPYLKIIAKEYPINVLSFEKKNFENKEKLKNLIGDSNITHQYLYYTSNFGKVGRLYDVIRLIFFSFTITYKNNFLKIHCRGHIPAYVGYLLKFFFRFNLIFDFRGFWVDERIDNASFYKTNLFYKIIFNFLKRLERQTLLFSDYIIVLTDKAVPLVQKIVNKKISNIIVIPTCADYNFFDPMKYKISSKKLLNELNLKNNKIITYCGSLGGVYLFEEMMNFFSKLLKYDKSYVFMIITNNEKKAVEEIAKKKYENIRQSIIIKNLDRKEVPLYLSISEIILIFINNTFARQASSPTKLAESFAMGIPVIANKGVGDMDSIIKNFSAGIFIDVFNDKQILKVIKNIDDVKKLGGIDLRNYTKKNFSLEYAKKSYLTVYRQLDKI